MVAIFKKIMSFMFIVVIFLLGIVIGFSVHIYKKEVITKNNIARLQYCAKPNSYLKRMLASNRTFLMYLHDKDYDAITIGLKAENQALKRAILWNNINMHN